MPHWTTKPFSTRKKLRIVIKMMAHEIVEAIGAQRRPRAGDADDEVALRRGEFHLIRRWRLRSQKRGPQQRAIVRAGRRRFVCRRGSRRRFRLRRSLRWCCLRPCIVAGRGCKEQQPRSTSSIHIYALLFPLRIEFLRLFPEWRIATTSRHSARGRRARPPP